MLCLRRIYSSALGRCHFRTLHSDALLIQLNRCTTEDQIFNLVGENKTKLSEKHLESAFTLLWKFQKLNLFRNINYIKNHSQFLTLCNLAENRIEFMDDDLLMSTLYHVLRFRVKAHDSLVEELVMEAWRRLERFSLSTLSKFAWCLYKQDLYTSPLIGKIAHIVNANLDSAQDARALSTLMVSISRVISENFQERLIQKAEQLFETPNSVHFSDAKRIVKFLHNLRQTYFPLLEKCTKVFLENPSKLDLKNIYVILQFYKSQHFNNAEFQLVIKQKLIKTIDDYNDPVSFSRLFVALGPLAGPEVRERLIASARLMAEEFNYNQTLEVLKAMQEMECKNSHLIQNIATCLHKYLDKYKPAELAKITRALVRLRCQDEKLYTKLRGLVVGYLQVNVVPHDISLLISVLSMLPFHQVDEVVIDRIEAIFPQCRFNDLTVIATALARWVRHAQSHQQNSLGSCVTLLKKISILVYEKLQTASDLCLLNELKNTSKDWFEEIFIEETMHTCQQLREQITWRNVTHLSSFLSKTSYLCIPLLDRIASVTVQNINKIPPHDIYPIVLPFTILNYDPPQSEEFFETCIQHFSSNLGSLQPRYLVLFCYALAVAGHFPLVLVKAIFNIEFLVKLHAELETDFINSALPDSLNKLIRLRLMQLNRAVCLECPEYQIPWFHERYCQEIQPKGIGHINTMQQQIHRMLVEIMGGNQYAKVSVLTPYYYRIDFECILIENRKPLTCVDHSLVADAIQWGPDIQLMGKKELAPGAKRIAVELLGSRAFCKNSYQPTGEFAMKKRHLEILGYQVVQISCFEWNSIKRSPKEAQMNYLKKSIFETK